MQQRSLQLFTVNPDLNCLEYNGGQWDTALVSQSVFSLCPCYVNIRVSQTIPQSQEAGTFQIHFIYRDVWNLKGCSIRICGFWRKKLLLSWGLLNKDLIALNACVQGKCYAIQLPVLGIPEWEQLLDIIHHLAWFEV